MGVYPSIAALLRHGLLHVRWRRLRRRGRTLRLGIGQVKDFLQSLQLRYVVLRWFEEVPLTPKAEAGFTGDVDVLIDGSELEALVQAAARFPGSVKFDIYSPTGRRGSAFVGMPYYPPVLAEEVLAARERHRDLFFVPGPGLHFKALAYHLVYHKGLMSGLPTGTELAPMASPKRDYRLAIEELARRVQAPIPTPCTLLALHEYLKGEEWSMPHDLMVRWPRQCPWMRWLTTHEESRWVAQAERFPNLIVFLLRDDAIEEPVPTRAAEMLRERFQVLMTVELDPGQIRRVTRSIRGGNWVEHSHTTLVGPRVAWICHDPRPAPIEPSDRRRVRYPRVSNANIFFKEEVRQRLNRLYPADPKRVAIHGSDNAIEAQHYLEAIFAAAYPEVCRELEKRVPRTGG